jgi:nuclease S1
MKRIVVVVGAVLSMQVPMFGWGDHGHRAVARLAEERLSPTARKAVAAILDGESLADVAMWADGVRCETCSHPHTYRWHFTNIPISASGYSATRDCKKKPNGDCVVRALARLESDLRDGVLDGDEQEEAVRFLIHFVGDLHQPLHAGDNNDLGGGRREIAEIGQSSNLHSAWDSGIIGASGKDEDDLVAAANEWLNTLSPATLTQMRGGRYIDWANESHQLARTVAYPQVDGDNEIDDDERKTALRIIEKRVARGGVRLAAVLNRILTSPHTEE